MGQKANPRSLRLKGVQEFLNNWFSIDNYALFLKEDVKIRDYIETNLKRSFISKVLIRRKGNDHVLLDIHTSKPGIILGKGGESINRFRTAISKTFKKKFNINVIEERSPDKSAKLLSELIAAQLEKRIPFRRAMKMVVQSALKAGADGVQVKCAGRLGGVEIARSEWYQKGRMPLHTFRAKIDYYFTEANTIYGKIGVKVWVNNGEVISDKGSNAVVRDAHLLKEKRHVNA
ncbi:MAG: 30S ribosomal protein S3 [Candidatus Marinamargulisbacteria bacterium]